MHSKRAKIGLRHDVVYEVFCFVLVRLHYLTLLEKEQDMELARVHDFSISFK